MQTLHNIQEILTIHRPIHFQSGPCLKIISGSCKPSWLLRPLTTFHFFLISPSLQELHSALSHDIEATVVPTAPWLHLLKMYRMDPSIHCLLTQSSSQCFRNQNLLLWERFKKSVSRGRKGVSRKIWRSRKHLAFIFLLTPFLFL